MIVDDEEEEEGRLRAILRSSNDTDFVLKRITSTLAAYVLYC